MLARENRGRARARSTRRQGTQPAKKDAVFSAMLAQITVCLVLLALAYSLSLSELPFFAQAKELFSSLMSSELSSLPALEEAISRWSLQLPVWQPQEDAPQQAPQGQGGAMNPVRFAGRRAHFSAPSGSTLSPFYITDKPILPVRRGSLTGSFGFRLHPITAQEDFHTGVDIAAPADAPIAAVLDGTVSEVGTSAAYGNFLVVRHHSGLETAYCHCSKILAPAGAVVRQGESIARVGSTGISTGNHVHLEFRVGGLRANPAWVYDEF